MRRTLAMLVALGMTATAAAATEVPFRSEFRIPALGVIWSALNEPTAEQMKLDWRDLDPRKDTARPDGFWRHWPTPFSPFYAGVKMPADVFTLASLYPD